MSLGYFIQRLPQQSLSKASCELRVPAFNRFQLSKTVSAFYNLSRLRKPVLKSIRQSDYQYVTDLKKKIAAFRKCHIKYICKFIVLLLVLIMYRLYICIRSNDVIYSPEQVIQNRIILEDRIFKPVFKDPHVTGLKCFKRGTYNVWL